MVTFISERIGVKIPVVILFFGCLLALLIGLQLPTQIESLVRQNAISDALTNVAQVKELRAYYTKNVVAPVLSGGDMEADYAHRGDDARIPLPATMVHELGERFSKAGRSLSLFSDYPFPHRAGRELDGFEREAWDHYTSGNTEHYTRTQTMDEREILRVAVADTMAEDACVACHNGHPESPKVDWKLGDVRGILELKVDLTDSLTTARHFSWVMAAILIAISAIGSLGLFVYMQRTLLSPIQQISEAAVAYAGGDFSTSVSAKGRNDEVATLVASLNRFRQQSEEAAAERAQREAERAVQASETRFRSVFETEAAGMALMDMDGRYYQVNDRFCEIVGYSRDELKMLTWREITHPDEIATVEALDHEVSSGARTDFIMERRMVRKDGSVIWTSLSSAQLKDEHGTPVSIFSFVQDISELKRAEERIQQNERNLRELLDSAPIGIGIVDQEKNERLFVNKKLSDMIGGGSREDVQNMNLADSYVNQSDLEMLQRLTAEGGGGVENVEVERRNMDGSTFWCLQSSQNLGEFEGRSARVVWMVGIDPLKNAQREMQQLAARNEENARLMEAIMNAIDQGFIVWDDDDTLVMANHRYADLWNYPRDMMKRGTDAIDLVRYQAKIGTYGPGDPEELAQARNKRVLDFKDGEGEHIQTPLGADLFIRRYSVPGLGMVSTFTDITELKRKESELSEKEAQLRIALDNMPSGIMVIDDDMNIHLFNEQYLELYELPEGAIRIGGSLKDMIRVRAERGDYGPGDPDELYRARVDGYDVSAGLARAENKLPSGRILETIRNQTGDGILVATCTDITERKQSEEALAHAYDQISSSIEYASNIQKTLLPDADAVTRAIGDHFVIWEPKDVVGGDIYLVREWGDGHLLMVCDCTGHGVPGAFMTIIVTANLNRAVRMAEPGNLSDLINTMHERMQDVLGQNKEGSVSDDGAELGFVYLPPNADHVMFAGAGFSLFTKRGEEVEQIKGDRNGIGYRDAKAGRTFHEHQVSRDAFDMLFLASDGVFDQTGGERGHGFGRRRLMRTLAALDEKMWPEMAAHILDDIVTYQGDQPRRDDITVIGFNGTPGGETGE